MISTETVYIVTSRDYADTPRMWLSEQMSGYDANVYRDAIASEGVNRVADDDWANIWTQGENVYPTREQAEASLDEFDARHIVVDIAREDVRDALLRDFANV